MPQRCFYIRDHFPSCRDPSTMVNEQLTKKRAEERQYLKTVMECIQYLARQGLSLRGSDHIDDNLTQLLVLRSKDNPAILERVFSNSIANKRKFKHQDYQNELLSLMANEVLRNKLNLIKKSQFFSTICDEYTDVANKEQLSFCVRWVDEKLCANEDFLGYYELPSLPRKRKAPNYNTLERYYNVVTMYQPQGSSIVTYTLMY